MTSYLDQLSNLADEIKGKGVNLPDGEYATGKTLVNGKPVYVTNRGGIFNPDGGQFLGNRINAGGNYTDVTANPNGGYTLVDDKGMQYDFNADGTTAVRAPGGPGPDIATNPSWLAYLRQFGVSESDARAYAEQQRSKITQGLTTALPQVAQQGEDTRRSLSQALEGRGVLQSGEAVDRFAQQRASEASQAAGLNSAAATDTQNVESGLSNTLGQLGRAKEEQRYNAERGQSIDYSTAQATNTADTSYLDAQKAAAIAQGKAQQDYYQQMIDAYGGLTPGTTTAQGKLSTASKSTGY